MLLFEYFIFASIEHHDRTSGNPAGFSESQHCPVALERRKFTKEEIVDWISRYKDGNINDPNYRREIIDTFVNSVYVYDDRLLLTYNYRDGSQALTLKEIEAALSSDLTSMCPTYMKNPNLFPIGSAFGFLVSIKDITY